MAGHSHSQHPASTGGAAKPNTKLIWRTFWILFFITALEFLIAFTMPANWLRVSIFVLMTLVKAFYIVGEFMHLKHETKSLIWTILVPSALLIWLLIALITEGSYYSDAVFGYFK